MVRISRDFRNCPKRTLGLVGLYPPGEGHYSAIKHKGAFHDTLLGLEMSPRYEMR